MKKTIWRKGPPPSVGWWIASVHRDKSSLRWWNGLYWSESIFKVNGAKHSVETVAFRAAMRSYLSDSVEWAPRPASWPARSKT